MSGCQKKVNAPSLLAIDNTDISDIKADDGEKVQQSVTEAQADGNVADIATVDDEAKKVSEKDDDHIYDWVEYLNEDGSYTKGSDLKKENEPEVQKGEEKTMTKSDLKSLPMVSEQDLLYYQNLTSDCYFYKRLSPEDQRIYCEMLSIISQHQEGVKLSTLDVDTVNRIYDYLWKDHAELFYVEGCTYISYFLKDELAALAFSGSYHLEAAEVEQHQHNVDRYVNDFLDQYKAAFPDGSDDYEKIKLWYEYLINHTEYDMDSSNNQNILSVMENGRSVCQGYARTTQYVLSRMGIETLLIVGSGRNGEPHAWNEVFADGEWYHLDATWGDASYEVNGDLSLIDSLPPVNYDYLLVNDSEIMKTHMIKNKEELPVASALTDNYYVREGAYFTDVNEDQLRAVFDYARIRGRSYVTLKMDSAETYKKMEDYLLVEQQIFEFIGEQETASYSTNQGQNYMVFWIK